MAATSTPKTGGESLDELVQRNVEIVAEIEKKFKDSRTWSDRLADTIAKFCGSMVFVWIHVAWFGSWLIINSVPALPKAIKWDQPPFEMLTLVVSLEAIFLSTFVLISQNRSQLLADKRANLDLQINLLAEEETTQLMEKIDRICEKLEIPVDNDMEQQTDIEKIVEDLDQILDLDTNPDKK